MVGYFLIILSFVAAIIGTLSQTTRAVKFAIVGIAAISAGASAWLYYEDEQEKALNKRLIVSLVQATQDETAFAEEIRIAANEVINNRGWNVGSLAFADTGIYLTANNSSDYKFAGAAFIDAQGVRNIRYALVTQTGLIEEMRTHLLSDLWTIDSIQNNWNRIAPVIGRLAVFTIEDFVPELVKSSLSFPNGNSIEIFAERDNDKPPYFVTLTQDQIEGLADVEPLKRGRLISETIVNQLVNQL